MKVELKNAILNANNYHINCGFLLFTTLEGAKMDYFSVLPIAIMLLAVALLYFSNKHQMVFAKTWPKKLRPVAYLLIIAAIITMALKYALSAAIFISLMVIMLSIILLPTFAHLTKGKTDE